MHGCAPSPLTARPGSSTVVIARRAQRRFRCPVKPKPVAREVLRALQRLDAPDGVRNYSIPPRLMERGLVEIHLRHGEATVHLSPAGRALLDRGQ